MANFLTYIGRQLKGFLQGATADQVAVVLGGGAVDAEWEENKHPREEDGKFTSGSGATIGEEEKSSETGQHGAEAGEIKGGDDPVNAIPMFHYTSEESVAPIKEGGFNPSTNSMYGKGIYFTNSDRPGKARLEVKLKPHKQLLIEKDTDAPEIYEGILGKKNAHMFDPDFPQQMVKAGYGSARINLGEGEEYTLVFDPSLIEIQGKEKQPTKDAQPTAAQAEAGNYPKGHLSYQGLRLSIENQKGSKRSGKDKDGNEWSTTMPAHYGYIRGTEGADGDHVDTYLLNTAKKRNGVYVVNPEAKAANCYIIDQIDPETGEFDEHKLVLGTDDMAEAMQTYYAGYSDGSGPWRMAAICELPMENLKRWLAEGDQAKPFHGQYADYYSKPELGAVTKDARWEETKHPRDEEGKFSSGKGLETKGGDDESFGSVLSDYQEWGYTSVNAGLRKGEVTEKESKQVALLDSNMKELGKQETLFRFDNSVAGDILSNFGLASFFEGGYRIPAADLLSGSFLIEGKPIDQWLSAKLRNGEFQEDAFCSATRNQKVAEKFAHGGSETLTEFGMGALLKIKAKESTKGIDVASVLHSKRHEEEVLLSRGSVFRIDGISFVDGGKGSALMEISCSVVGQDPKPLTIKEKQTTDG